jgi:hypothetical protein
VIAIKTRVVHEFTTLVPLPLRQDSEDLQDASGSSFFVDGGFLLFFGSLSFLVF